MNMSFSIPNGLKEKLWTGLFDFEGDTFKMILVRPDFSFSAANHLLLKNLKATTATTNLRVFSSGRYIEAETANFITDGYVPGNLVTFTGDAGDADTNDGQVWQVRSVEATKLYVSMYDASVIYNEDSNTAGEPPVTTIDYFSASLAVDEELSSSVEGAESYVAGGCAITFTIDGDQLLVDSVDFSDLGGMSACMASGGGIIYNDSATNDDIVAHVRFSAYVLYL